jgi:hypothetical protein
LCKNPSRVVAARHFDGAIYRHAAARVPQHIHSHDFDRNGIGFKHLLRNDSQHGGSASVGSLLA